MTCEICDSKIVERNATQKAPYHYKLCGLPDVFLIGINIRRCIKCAEEWAQIPRLKELHLLIAKGLCDKNSPLDGAELRYLRKFAGFSSQRFAALLEIDPSHLSRVENGDTPHLGGSADKLARALSMTAVSEDYAKKILLELADTRIRNKAHPGEKKVKPTFRLIRNRWTQAVA